MASILIEERGQSFRQGLGYRTGDNLAAVEIMDERGTKIYISEEFFLIVAKVVIGGRQLK